MFVDDILETNNHTLQADRFIICASHNCKLRMMMKHDSVHATTREPFNTRKLHTKWAVSESFNSSASSP